MSLQGWLVKAEGLGTSHEGPSSVVDKLFTIWEINQRTKREKINLLSDMISRIFRFPGQNCSILPNNLTHQQAESQGLTTKFDYKV